MPRRRLYREGNCALSGRGEEPGALRAGDAFFEPPNKTILHFDNASATEPMTFIAFYLLGENETELIHILD